MWTKRQFIEQAFSEAGLAGYAFDLQPEQLETALRQLDAMMAGWAVKGIRLGWPVPADPSASSLNQVVSVPLAANEAIYLNLAIRIAPGFGKTVAIETKNNAKDALEFLMAAAAHPIERVYPGGLPSGAGNKNRQSGNFMYPSDPELPNGVGGLLDYE